jgi:uncharacterized Zn finger protein
MADLERNAAAAMIAEADALREQGRAVEALARYQEAFTRDPQCAAMYKFWIQR